MNDLESIRKKYMSGPQAGALKAAAASPEGKAIAGMVDSRAVEEAARRGDADALGNILQSVLATEEGRRLAKQLSDALGGR